MNKKDARILVVDDERGIRDLLFFELSSEGYQVVTAQDGAEALAKAQKEKFQLIITDVMMPKMDGIALLSAVKKLDPSIEVIVSTGFGHSDTISAAIKEGAYSILLKPVDMNDFLELVDKLVEKLVSPMVV